MNGNKERFFIFNYKLITNTTFSYGNYGLKSKVLPPLTSTSEAIAKVEDCKAEEVAILSFNEVSSEDFKSFLS
jgi:hypothetical protein